MARLSDAELAASLGTLPGWSVETGQLVKGFTFATFSEAIAFVNRVAELAEEVQHHPDMLIQYATVTMRLSTHSEGGITDKDTQLARGIEQQAKG
jgi:4a-hydroxytetrahydrobiopterin dehydratase